MSAPTPEQAAAIAAEGDVLVMAGAGTGKTRTLVDRLMDRILRPEDPLSLDRVLMVTFTEAAAAEMRSRLRDRLLARAGGEAGDGHVARQLLLLDTAAIGTLHAFCLRLIRDHFHELGLDPRLEVLDEAASRRVAGEALAAVMEPLYDGAGDLPAAVRDLAARWFEGDLDRFESVVLDLHARLRSLADPDDWLCRARAAWEPEAAGALREGFAGELRSWAADWRLRLESLPPGHPKVPGLLDALAVLAAGSPEPGRDLSVLAEADGAWPRGRKTVLRQPLVGFFTEVAALRSWWDAVEGNPDPLVEDWTWCRPAMVALLEVVERFASEYSRRKRASGRLDFSDLEQHALDLLGHRSGPGVEATAAARSCRERFVMVLVDEAQDLNEAQDAILRAVARPAPEGNRFLVGDVKQSIYRFRFAEPRLFQDYARRWHAAGGGGRVLPLTGNFRSAESLLGFVNAVFHAIQRPEAGGVAYDEEARLRFGAPEARVPLSAERDADPRVEVHLQVPSESAEGEGGDGDAEDDELSRLQTEARRVAHRLRELHDAGHPVWDAERGGFRPVGWGDMAVLLRAERSRIADFAAAFRTLGVPLVARQGDFFTRPEVSDLQAALELVDNPLQDLPLLAALRSPLVGMSDVNGLAVVRIFARREERWWTLLRRFHDAGRRLGAVHPEIIRGEAPPAPPPEAVPAVVDEQGRAVLEGDGVFLHPDSAAVAARAWVHADRLIGFHRRWRDLSRQGSVRTLLEAILDDTGYEAHLEALPGSADALANVRQLLEVARRFDRSHRGGVYRFLRHLQELHSADALESGAGASVGDAVQLLTIHRSKGLEFPVVAVANLGSPFHLGDLHGARVLFHETRGLCPRVVTPSGADYPSLALWWARREEMRERLGEEIRLLYVALTRARDRLLLFGTSRRKAPSEAWAEAAGTVVDADGSGPRLSLHELLGARCPLDWLGPLFGAMSLPDWASRAEGVGRGFSWRVWDAAPAVEAGGGEATPAIPDGQPAGPASPVPYAHEAATEEPAKTTVTALRRRLDALDGDDNESAAFPWGPRSRRRPAGAPSDRTAAERGILHHRFLEHVQLERTGSVADLDAERRRLVDSGHLTPDEAAGLDLAALERFWNSPLGLRVRGASRVLREYEVTFRLDVADLRTLGLPCAGLAEEEFVVAQGVVDLAFEEAGGLVVVDFKTDAVAPGQALEARVAGYRPQLAAYALALGRIRACPVRECWLHFLATGDSVAVPV